MSCVICKKTSDPWLLLKNENIYTNEENKPIGKTIQTCGYSCCRKLDSKLPKNYSHLVLNKEDFSYLRPIKPQKTKEFQILTFEEIMNMTDSEKEKYYTEKEEKINNDFRISELYHELEKEEELTYQLENIENTSSESDYDDY